MTRPQPLQPTAASAAGLVAGLVAALGLGIFEGPRALNLLEGFEAGASDVIASTLFSAGLLAAPLMCLGAIGGGVMASLPLDMSPSGVYRAASGLWSASGARAAKISGGLWAGLAGLGVCFGALFAINRWFMATFHNQTLSSLLLALVAMIVAATVAAATIWSALALGRAMARLAPRPGFAPLTSPRLPIGLAVVAGLGAAIAAPILYEEIWKALNLKTPTAVVLLLGALWLGGGLLAVALSRRAMKWRVLAAVAALLVGLSCTAATYGLFGSSPSHSALASAISDHGLLVAPALAQAHAWTDGDGDGFSHLLAGGDCDDHNPNISPAADELPDNGVDEDCDGQDLQLKIEPPTDAPDPTKAKPPSDRVTKDKDPLDSSRQRYNIVWILADTLRWDHTGWGGYHRPTTPHSDTLAARATIFENGYSISSMTPMVIGPMMTGQWPSEPLRAYKHFVEYDDEGNTTVAELLRDAGYMTAASTSHWYLKRYSGLGQGFSRWSTFTVSRAKMYEVATSKQVTDTAIEMLDHLNRGTLPPKGPQDAHQPDPPPRKDGAKPWFLYLHYVDPHATYIHHPGHKPFGRGYLDKYDGEVRFMDHHLGRLYEALEAHDPGLENTIVVMTSDHGEGFGHKDIWMHVTNLYEPLIRAAYFIYLPGATPRRITQRVSLIDVAPTLLDAVGLKIPPQMRGVSILPQLALGAPFKPRPIYTEMPPGPATSHRRSLIVGDLKLIHKIKGNTWSLYDLAADPDERKNLWFVRKDDAKAMKAAYLRFRATQVKATEARR